MSNKRLKSLLQQKMENPEHRKRHDEQYAAFKLEVQILDALERKGWTYDDLAQTTNTQKSNISRDLRAGGILSASFSRIARIAEALGMKLLALLIPKEQEQLILPKIEALVRESFNTIEIKMSEPPSTTINAGEGSGSTVNQDQIQVNWNPALLSLNRAEGKLISATFGA